VQPVEFAIFDLGQHFLNNFMLISVFVDELSAEYAKAATGISVYT
jgi:hypothetical protein